jgi:flavin reductase (DIM6/NTAB) family NADH-FMN oxidoreductase RutF
MDITSLPQEHWDRLFAPSSCLAIITTVDEQGRVNAAAYGTCTRVCHDPVDIAFTTGFRFGTHTGHNVITTKQFVVNLPAFDPVVLGQVRVVGLPFGDGVNELEKAGLTELPSTLVKPPRIAECTRHFECEVQWTHDWANRRMVVGRVVAASAHADCIDANGYVRWNRVKSAHYCGAPYGGQFVAAYETVVAPLPYEGPEADDFLARTKKVFGA